MTKYPNEIFEARETENLPGITYDPTNKKNFYSEDFQNLGKEITAIEQTLGQNIEGEFSTLTDRLEYHETDMLAEKKDTPVTTTITTSVSPKPKGYGMENEYYITGLSVDATFAIPTPPYANGNTLLIRIKDAGTSKNLNWNAVYRPIGVTLPTKTTANKTIYIGAIYNSQASKWDVISVREEE